MIKAKSFRTKLWLYFVLFAAIIFSLLWILQTIFLQSFYNAMLTAGTKTAAEEICANIKSDNIEEIIDRLAYDNSLLVFVTGTDGTILYSSDSYKSSYHQTAVSGGGEENPYHRDTQLSWQMGSYRNLPDDYDRFLTELNSSDSGKTEYQSDNKYVFGAYIDTAGGEKAVLYVSAALGPVGAAATIIQIQLLWVTILSFVIAFVLAYFIAKRFSAPIKQLSDKAQRLGEDDYTKDFEKGFCNELDELGSSLDRTAAKLSETKSYQKDLLANVSHDLRTPLTMIKGYAEMVRDVSWEDEQQRNADTGVIIKEADRLTALVNEILEYSQLQTDNYKKNFTTVNLSLLTQKVIGRFEPLFRRNGGVIEKNIADGCCVYGNVELLERAVYNLIDNAIRHTDKSRKITVTVCPAENGKIRLEVRDYGEGIDKEELPHIWEKYYTSRQRGNKGVSGLGLAIVKQIAEIHGAEYGADSEKASGSVFWLEMQKGQ